MTSRAMLGRDRRLSRSPKAGPFSDFDIFQHAALTRQPQSGARLVRWETETPAFDRGPFRHGSHDFHGARPTGAQSAAMNLTGNSVVKRGFRLHQGMAKIGFCFALDPLVFELDGWHESFLGGERSPRRRIQIGG